MDKSDYNNIVFFSNNDIVTSNQ